MRGDADGRDPDGGKDGDASNISEIRCNWKRAYSSDYTLMTQGFQDSARENGSQVLCQGFAQ